MKLSIIVPVYNVEPYLPRCIDSILAQTFTDFELILVDDGSIDNSPAICDEYAKKDSRIVVVHQENSGVSVARNVGLDIAQGEYIGFVDSDDFIHPQTYEIAIQTAQKHKADIVQWDCILFSNSEEIRINSHVNLKGTIKELIQSDNIVDTYYPDICKKINSTVWNKLYKRLIFDVIRFPKGLIYEDAHVAIPTLCVSKIIVIIEEKLYYYFQRDNSIMHEDYSSKCFSAFLVAINQMALFSKRKKYMHRNYAARAYLDEYTRHILMVHFRYKQYKKDFAPYRRQYLGKLRYIIFNPTVCRMKKLMALMLVISPKIAYKICRKYFPECLFKPMRSPCQINTTPT